MDKEQLTKIINNAITTVTTGLKNPLCDAISKAVCDSYEAGWNDCKKFFNIKDEDYLKEH